MSRLPKPAVSRLDPECLRLLKSPIGSFSPQCVEMPPVLLRDEQLFDNKKPTITDGLNYLFSMRSRRADSNRWPADYESAALPAELRRQKNAHPTRGEQ